MNGRDILIYLSIRHLGDWDKILASIKKREDFDLSKALEETKKITSKVVTIVDPDYPSSLKEAPKPPFVLYYHGDLGLIGERKKCITYIGSRKASSYGLKMAKSLCGAAAKEGFSLVSGLAHGIDGAAGRAALPHGRAVAVLGNGIDYFYPAENSPLQREIKQRGLLLSEYPFATPPLPERFPARNRLLAALSQLTVVGEASPRSGTLITVGYALSIGRDVACIPYRADEESACNALIKDGAPMIETPQDLYDLMGYRKDPETKGDGK